MYTKEQIEIINTAINNIKLLCKSNNDCVHCPMNNNCNEQPAHWKEVNNG